ncbi:2-phosphosulfolactate phosphatase [Oceanithermus sp.]|uniref:2-phosphosulfolactate phosphatase n=1 Tax=Oceanithermus sp. TaxID=2268145 RepID=UPI0025F6502D|nr:2-phosphosulfolactate phosphatase [Oceanithermus sp.]
MPFRISAVLSPAEPVPPAPAALVVDVIRATTTAAYLLNAGARELWLTSSLEGARALAERQGALLAGERGGLPPEGFDLGNSPREVRPERVRGRGVVMTTTNGTRAALRAAEAVPEVALAALVNAGAAVLWAAGRGDGVALVAAGREGRVALDDAYTLGALVTGLRARVPEAELDDGARLAEALFLAQPDARSALAASAAARALEPVGLAADVEVCARADALAVLPVLAERGDGALRFAPVYPKGV